MPSRIATGLIWGSLACYVLYAGFVAAALTGWFRRDLSLEDRMVLQGLLNAGIVIALVHALALFYRPESRLLQIICLLSLALGIGSGSYLMYTTHGRYFPELPKRVDRNAAQVLSTPQGELAYFIELEEPFSTSHKEYLVVSIAERRLRIPLPLFREPTAGYAAANRPADWGSLEPSEHPGRYRLKTTAFLRKAVFQVDLDKRTAIEIEGQASD